jgi:hypothetical protein
MVLAYLHLKLARMLPVPYRRLRHLPAHAIAIRSKSAGSSGPKKRRRRAIRGKMASYLTKIFRRVTRARFSNRCAS